LEYKEYLKRIPLFAGLSEGDIDKISKLVRERAYKKNMIIFMEGEPGEAVYFLRCGKVKIYKTSEDGREYIINIMGPGDIFAESVLFTGGNYPASAEVIEDAQVCMIKNKDLEELIRGNSEIALRIIKIMAERLQRASELIKSLALDDTFRRTALQLLKLAEEKGIKYDSEIKIEMKMTKQELAKLVGTSRETVTRILSQMKKEKVVYWDRDGIYIKNLERLRRWI